jgi:hypothetical protein
MSSEHLRELYYRKFGKAMPIPGINPSSNERLLNEALVEAILSRRKTEKAQGFTGDSCQLASWRDLYFERTGVKIEKEEDL